MIKFRENIEKMKWYSSGKKEFSWKAEIFLDTNENPYDLFWLWINRYPDPLAIEVKKELIKVKKQQFWIDLKQENIMLDNWSDNIIDLLVRIFCEPKKDKIAYFSPTFWMYKIAAELNDVWIKEFELDENFEIPFSPHLTSPKGRGIEQIKLIFICNPNNPSGNLTISLENIEKLLQNFNTIVVVDEAYIDFCPESSAINLIEKYDNLVILQTFSKLWGLAGIRCWMAFSNKKIIEKLNTVKAPYNLNSLTQEIVLKQLKNSEIVFDLKNKIIKNREVFIKNLEKIKFVKKIFKTNSNFVLVKFEDWQKVFEYLRENWIIVRNFSSWKYTKNCLRVSIWTEKENKTLIDLLKNYA